MSFLFFYFVCYDFIFFLSLASLVKYIYSMYQATIIAQNIHFPNLYIYHTRKRSHEICYSINIRRTEALRYNVSSLFYEKLRKFTLALYLSATLNKISFLDFFVILQILILKFLYKRTSCTYMSHYNSSLFFVHNFFIHIHEK